jgi:hypothetical protein
VKQTILVCDHCQERPRRHAVQSVALQNGRATRGVASLDLCEKHYRELVRFFRQRNPMGAPAAGEQPKPEGKKLKLTDEQRASRAARLKKHQEEKMKPKWAKMWEERLVKVAAVLEKSKGRWVQTPDIAKASRMNRLVARECLNRLIRARKVTRQGAGPHTAYQLS